MWYRIFGGSSTMPTREELREFLDFRYGAARCDFFADGSGWYRGEVGVDEIALQLERFGAEEPGIRAELNSWAAWLETREQQPEHARLMEKVIQTKQLFTLRAEGDTSRGAGICLDLCRFLAEKTSGIYQIDGDGFFSAEGRLLVSEE
jgi:hypothetical protein